MSAVAGASNLHLLTPAPELLRAGMDRLGLCVREYARRVGVDASLVSKVLRGERKIPKRSVALWAVVLHLDGASYRDFTLAAHLDRTDPAVREHINALREQLAAKGVA